MNGHCLTISVNVPTNILCPSVNAPCYALAAMLWKPFVYLAVLFWLCLFHYVVYHMEFKENRNMLPKMLTFSQLKAFVLEGVLLCRSPNPKSPNPCHACTRLGQAAQSHGEIDVVSYHLPT
jgi:hypothetical protein